MDDPKQGRAAVAVDAALLEDARTLGVDATAAAEAGLASAVRAARVARWKTENAGAIAEYNAYIEKHGIPLSQYRKF